MTSGHVTGGLPKLDPIHAPNLVGRAMRARMWHRVELGHRATLRLVRRGRMGSCGGSESLVIRRMVAAANAVLEALRKVPGAPPFRVRALLEGIRMAKYRMQTYDEHGAFRWAPQARRWLGDEDVVIHLGANSLCSPRYGGL